MLYFKRRGMKREKPRHKPNKLSSHSHAVVCYWLVLYSSCFAYVTPNVNIQFHQSLTPSIASYCRTFQDYPRLWLSAVQQIPFDLRAPDRTGIGVVLGRDRFWIAVSCDRHPP